MISRENKIAQVHEKMAVMGEFAVSVKNKDETIDSSKNFFKASSLIRQNMNRSAAEALRASLFPLADKPSSPKEKEDLHSKRKAEAEEEEEVGEMPIEKKQKVEREEPKQDSVKLWEDGWKERYYSEKFKAEPNDMEIRKNVVLAYLEGLCWVLKYYYQGCPSWKWYYPYHYAPFASDFPDVDLKGFSVHFELGKPFQPLEQLMGVLPAAR
jgi:5'-3' exonuclease